MSPSTDLVPLEQWRALQPDANALEIIRENLDGEQLSEFSLARVKMPTSAGKHYSIATPSGDVAATHIDGVVLFFKSSRSYWESKYEGGNEPPDCSSADARHARPRNDEIEIPAPTIEEGPYSGYLACDGCTFSEWGTAVRDGEPTRGQACKLTKQLFVLTPERMLPIVVSLPPTSLKVASNYFVQLADFGIDYKSIITRIGIQKVSGKGVPDYSAATFEKVDDLPPEQAATIAEYARELRPHFERVRIAGREEVGA